MPSSSKAQTPAERQSSYVKRKVKLGWSRRTVWVPPEGEDDFQKAKVKLQKKWVAL